MNVVLMLSQARANNILSLSLLCLLSLMLVSLSDNALAQSSNSAIKKLDDETYLWKLIESSFNATKLVAESETSLPKLRELLSQKCSQDFELEASKLQILEEANYWDKNYGVELRGGLTTGDLDSSELDRQGSTYLELSWDILSNGMKEFDHRAKNLRRQAAVQTIRNDLQDQGQQAQCRNYHIQNAFGGTYSRLYNAKLSLIEPVLAFEQRAYLNGLSYLDELFISEEQVVNLRLRLRKLNDLSFGQSSNEFHPTVLDIDMKSLLDDLRSDPRFAKISELTEQGAQRFNPYRNGNRLRFFLRKEFDLLSSDRDDFVAGLRFSVPLSFQDRPSYQSSLSALQREAELELWERENRVRANYNDYLDQLERTITQQYRYLRTSEKMKRVLNRKLAGDNIVVSAAVVRALNYMDAVIELIEAKQALFERMNRVLLASRLDFKAEYIVPINISNKSNRARPFTRGIYIWSPTFNAIDNRKLTEVLNNQQITTLYMSNSKNLDRVKAKQFIDDMYEQDRKVKLMLGDNSWFRPSKHQEAAQKVAAVGSLTGYVHLDIEPQALDSYDGNEREYQSQFVEMIRQIREDSQDTNLSIAVPFHWLPETYKALNPLVDEFVLMNYGKVSDDARIRRINNMLDHISKSKLQIALRPEDFNSPFEMESALALINEATGIDDFVFHDLRSLIDEINRQGEME